MKTIINIVIQLAFAEKGNDLKTNGLLSLIFNFIYKIKY